MQSYIWCAIFFLSCHFINMNEIILRTPNYYRGIDPQHYYRSSSGDALEGKATRATDFKNVYLSDLLNNPKCSVSFTVYRDVDDKTAHVKTTPTGMKSGIVMSYNPETNLLAIDCAKKRPNRLSTLFRRTNKVRYVEPNKITVSSIGRYCLLRRVSRSASSPKARPSPKARSTSSPKARPSPKTRSTSSPKAMFRGGKRTRITIKNNRVHKTHGW